MTNDPENETKIQNWIRDNPDTSVNIRNVMRRQKQIPKSYLILFGNDTIPLLIQIFECTCVLTFFSGILPLLFSRNTRKILAFCIAMLILAATCFIITIILRHSLSQTLQKIRCAQYMRQHCPRVPAEIQSIKTQKIQNVKAGSYFIAQYTVTWSDPFTKQTHSALSNWIPVSAVAIPNPGIISVFQDRNGMYFLDLTEIIST